MIDHLRAQARLPERQLAIAEAALQTGGATLEQALLEAGVDAEQIVQISQMVAEAQRMDEPRSGERHASGSGGRHRAEEAPAEPSVDDLIARLMDITPRFELQGEIARGAMGRILAAWDLHLGRPVAIKVLRKTAARDLDRVRFLEEAQVTGQLAHPSVMPVYELGRLRGQVAFVMKRVEGQSLKTIIGDLRQGRRSPSAGCASPQHLPPAYGGGLRSTPAASSTARSQAFQRHGRRLPARSLLDWGLCKALSEGTPLHLLHQRALAHGPRPDHRHRRPTWPRAGHGHDRPCGRADGRLRAGRHPVPPGSRCGRPSRARSARSAAGAARGGGAAARARPRARHRPRAEPSACAASPGTRPTASNAKALADRITAYPRPQGAAGAGGRLGPPQRRPGRGRPPAESSGRHRAGPGRRRRRRAASAAPIPRAQAGALGGRRSLCGLLHIDYADAFGTAVAALTRTIALSSPATPSPGSSSPTSSPGTRRPPLRQDHGRAAYYRRAWWPSTTTAGTPPSRAARAACTSTSRPPGARVEVVRLVEHGPPPVAGPVHDRGVAPLALDVAVGGGLPGITLEAPGHHPLVSPLLVQAGRSTRMRLRMLPTGSVPAGFVHIPAGTFRYGSPRSDLVGPAEHALPDFLITRAPVTVAEYLAFLDAVVQREPEEARRRVPRGFDGVAPAWRLGPEGQFRLPDGEGWRADLPVVGIRLDDARAYARWRSQREGLALRLPFEEEWEKAARGTEGRSFSWGHEWDAGYAAGPEVWRGHLPPPVGYAEADRSAYGVIDLVGGVREWTSSVEAGAGARVIVRGGSFLTGGIQGRPLWNREVLHPDRTAMDLGFRLVREL
ncbi:MAG: SUMF1/EgtB/PvdO family nonheme iron enzyme [bacterium]